VGEAIGGRGYQRHKWQRRTSLDTQLQLSLHDLQNDTESPTDVPNHHHFKRHYIKKNTLLNHNKAKSTPTRKLKRILLIGDSHMRGCASELGNYLGPNYRVTGSFMPGSRLQNITKLARKQIADFSKEDTVIIWGGSNDANRNESLKGLMNLNEYVDQRNNTNIMIVQIPHRHDLSVTSCINKEVLNFNKKLMKIMKCKDNVRILNCNLVREDFTQHGLHLNASGKAKVAKLMSLNISPQSENRKKPPIALKWYTTRQDTSTINSIPAVLNEEYVVMSNEGGKDEQLDTTIKGIETTSLCNEGGDDDQLDSTSQGLETTNVANGIHKSRKDEQVLIKNKERNEDQMISGTHGNRVSTRPKKSPNTRSDDFLWT
jgi:hypothetical protein